VNIPSTLDDAVEAFVDGLAGEVESLAAAVDGIDAERLRTDVVVEAYNLSCAFIDADGLHTDDELWALVAAFGHRLPTDIARARPSDLRDAGLLAGRRAHLDGPSAMLDILVAADARDGGGRALRYARLGSQIGHTVAALDLLPSRTELVAVDRFRATVQRAIAGAAAGTGGTTAGPTGGQAAGTTGGRGAGGAASGGTGSTGGTLGPGRTGGAATDRGPGGAGPTAGSGPTGPGTPGTPGTATAAGPAAGAGTAGTATEELPPARPLEELLAELDALVGLADVKREVRLVANLLRVEQIRRRRGLPVLEQSRHLVFTGNPGTGKTTVARLLAQIYRTLGVVERGQLVESDRAGLVAGFVGQTAGRVVAAFDRAEEGVLLIDEAYSLARGGEGDFGREAIDTLVKLVEDRRDRLVVIIAGYPDEMAALVDANPGMKSRFPKVIHFPDYDDDELLSIVEAIGAGGSYHLDDGARAAVRAWLAAQPRGRGFGNGRLARNLFEAAVANQATRLVDVAEPTDEQLTTLRADDIPSPDGTAPPVTPARARTGTDTPTGGGTGTSTHQGDRGSGARHGDDGGAPAGTQPSGGGAA